jgi:hypothetical protein
MKLRRDMPSTCCSTADSLFAAAAVDTSPLAAVTGFFTLLSFKDIFSEGIKGRIRATSSLLLASNDL